jgi:hypothetical protein
MRKTVKKLYMDRAEVRDYDVKECVQKGESFKIEFQNEVMTLTPEDLITKIESKSPQKSKFDGKNYVLFGYNWNPDKIEL